MIREEVLAPGTGSAAECEGALGGRLAGANNVTAADAACRQARVAGEPAGKKADAAAIRVPARAKGRLRSSILDFGKEVVGSIRLRKGRLRGEVVDTQGGRQE